MGVCLTLDPGPSSSGGVGVRGGNGIGIESAIVNATAVGVASARRERMKSARGGEPPDC